MESNKRQNLPDCEDKPVANQEGKECRINGYYTLFFLLQVKRKLLLYYYMLLDELPAS